MPAPIPVIIDTDPGVDDALALMLAAASPEIEVLAVTTLAGNVALEQATENARRILPVAWGDRPPPPIYAGSDRAVETAEFVHGADGLGNVRDLLDADGMPRYPSTAPLGSGSAVEAILSLVEQRPGEIVVITLGPLTNLAAVLRDVPSGMLRVRRVVIMGGAFREAGNATPAAEYNIWADPESAQAVCDSGLPITWVPVDVTHRCLLSQAALHALPETRRTRFARDCSGCYMDFHLQDIGELTCYLHDPVAIAAVVAPGLLRSRPLRVDVECFGAHTRGMTLADFRTGEYFARPEPNADVCLDVDAAGLLQLFLSRLPGAS